MAASHAAVAIAIYSEGDLVFFEELRLEDIASRLAEMFGPGPSSLRSMIEDALRKAPVDGKSLAFCVVDLDHSKVGIGRAIRTTETAAQRRTRESGLPS